MIADEHGGGQRVVVVGPQRHDRVVVVPLSRLAPDAPASVASQGRLGEGTGGGMAGSRPHGDGERHIVLDCEAIPRDGSRGSCEVVRFVVWIYIP